MDPVWELSPCVRECWPDLAQKYEWNFKSQYGLDQCRFQHWLGKSYGVGMTVAELWQGAL